MVSAKYGQWQKFIFVHDRVLAQAHPEPTLDYWLLTSGKILSGTKIRFCHDPYFTVGYM
jgi:hypothetical protein